MSAPRSTDKSTSEQPFDREVVASFSSLSEAERAVGHLAGADVPVDKLRIVGHGLRIVRPSDRTFRSIIEAGVVGAAVGGLIIVVAAIFGLGDALADGVTVAAFLLGATCGLAAGTTAFVATRIPLLGAEAQLYAERYDLAADPTIAERAAFEIDSVPGESPPLGLHN